MPQRYLHFWLHIVLHICILVIFYIPFFFKLVENKAILQQRHRKNINWKPSIAIRKERKIVLVTMLLRSHVVLLSVLLLPLLLCSAVAGNFRPRGLTEPDKKAGSNTDDDHELDTATDPPATDPPTFDVPTPAASLDVFKNIDPEIFEWINPDNIAAGQTTCGFLKPDLGSDYATIIYPKIKVYMCVQFATNQPAPKGNMVVHCGGPSTLSDCLVRMSDRIGQDNVDIYNVISLDQRGIGRSYPSIVHPECEYIVPSLPTNELEYTKDIVQDILDKQKEVVQACWSCKECGFLMEGTNKEDGTTVPLHFLEYSGTLQLAEDLYRFMILIKAEKLSLYGISYGTNVMGTFATVFPSLVDKFVIDSNMDPESQLLPFAKGKAAGMNIRLDYMIYTCWAARQKDPELCPIEDLRQCLTSIKDVIFDDSGTQLDIVDIGEVMYPFIIGAEDNVTLVGDLCEKASKNDVAGVHGDLCALGIKLANICGDDLQKKGVGLISCDDYDGPTYDPDEAPPGIPYCYAVPVEQYAALGPNLPSSLIDGMDYAGGQAAYNDKVFIQEVMDFQNSQESEVALFIAMLMMNYYWPKNIPLPIRGSPEIKGIVSGQLYDRATEYEWTQKMRAYFPNTNLLTSQSNAHGLYSALDGGACQAHIIKYFQTGELFVDGTVCGDSSASYGNFVR